MLRETNIDGDGQGDLRVHGGTYKAIYGYPFDHYNHWQQNWQRDDLTYGQFGENLTLEGLLEEAVHIGDVFQIGSAVKLQITQPRVHVSNWRTKMGLPAFPSSFWRVGASGSISECLKRVKSLLVIRLRALIWHRNR